MIAKNWGLLKFSNFSQLYENENFGHFLNFLGPGV